MGIEQLLMVGISQEAPIGLREKVCFDKRTNDALAKLKKIDGILEAVILSTCHRSEIYAVASEPKTDVLTNFFSDFFALDDAELAQYIYALNGICAVKHLFRVACGLESMVVGEDQILSQVKQAWEIAKKCKSTGKYTNKIFQESVTLGKNARSKTGITNHSLSVSYIAVLFILDVFKDLHDKNIFVIGAGEMGKLVIKHLVAKGARCIYISNRTYENALKLKEEIPEVTVVPYEQKYEYINLSHVVISATNAPHYTVNLEKFTACHRPGDKICMVDIALPRDIDPRIGEIDGVTLFTIDDLKRTAAENQKKREHLVSIIEDMIEESLNDIIRWDNAVYAEKMIRHMNEYADEVCRSEYERVKNKLQDLDEKEKEKIKYSLERVAAKIVNRYLIGLKTLAEEEKLDESVVNVFAGGIFDEKNCKSRESAKPAGISAN